MEQKNAVDTRFFGLKVSLQVIEKDGDIETAMFLVRGALGFIERIIAK